MNTDEDLKKLLAGSLDDSMQPNDRVVRGLKRARTSLGQQQALGFILVKIWVAIAKIMAPFFANAAKQNAQAQAANNTRKSESNPNGGTK